MTSSEMVAVSLLWPDGFGGSKPTTRHAPSEADLGLSAIIPALDLDRRHSRFIAGVLTELTPEPKIIAYRQEILADLLRLPSLVTDLTALLPTLGELAGAGRSGWGDSLSFNQLGTRLYELERYVNCVQEFCSLLERVSDALQAPGLLALRTFLEAVRQEPDFARLAAELPKLRAQLDQAGSVTVGINLDAQLQPEAATLISINQGRFSGKGNLLERLLGDWANANTLRGVSALYKAEAGKGSRTEHDLYREMNDLLEKIVLPVADALAQYARLSSAALSALEPELAFYLGAVRLTNELRAAGLTLCRPEIAPVAEQIGLFKGVYSLDLALRLRTTSGANGATPAIIPNDVAFGPEAAIFILTGPNSGGKTTYLRAIGQAQVLFQAGLLIPGQQARLSPVDGIFTHFATAERLDLAGGRLEEELTRLAQIFGRASSASLVLLNEPLASTDHVSARTLSRELLGGLRLLGARAVYVTHLLELVEDSVVLAGSTPGPAIVSLVAGVNGRPGNGKDASPTYTIRPGQPYTLGYAAELARQHGLSLAQIAQTLRERGLTT